MMIRRIIRRIIYWAQEDRVTLGSEPYNSTKSNPSLRDINKGINFTIFSAVGGKVVQVHSYDSKTDRTTGGLHIITDDEDLGEELALIITRESISR